MAAEMMKAGTLADSARATHIEEQVTQDWKNRHKLFKKWAKSCSAVLGSEFWGSSVSHTTSQRSGLDPR